MVRAHNNQFIEPETRQNRFKSKQILASLVRPSAHRLGILLVVRAGIYPMTWFIPSHV